MSRLQYCLSFYCFFFKEPATTEIYTYLHTLSLPDALPICSASSQRKRASASTAPASRLPPARRPTPSRATSRSADPSTRSPCSARPTGSRSEEHTSELQSLMRNSYAVFCLKKKTYVTIQQHTHTYHVRPYTKTHHIN